MNNQELANGTVEAWTPEEVLEALKSDEIVLIDVRTPQEYMFEHIQGSLLAPMHCTEPKSYPTQDGKRIVLHCGSGVRSAKIANDCFAAGYTHMAHLEGGFAAWKAAKQPYIGTDMASGAPVIKCD
ncbi:rhodanese-like domain-containing protein [uncultured Cohaesibacter sp.]|uniref:rhodanese-like domain-containing protein n=1 Tax=uncultured Cohaesibacter sp. TaxID=1002546 RepID=UPI00292E2014|nr:rhodanese-like domain-containing protein [uncultured Cohaesibacter sp.]